MPLFKIEGGRSAPVDTPAVARSAFPGHASRVVADQLDALLGEQLLPVHVRHEGEDAPYLLAVDAAGQPVVVEVTSRLDRDAVVTAMRHAGRASLLTLTDLGKAYGDPERFTDHLADFRSGVPMVSTAPGQRGSRLILVCAEVDPELDDVVEFLLQWDHAVDVLKVGVVHDAAGRPLVDVSRVTRRPGAAAGAARERRGSPGSAPAALAPSPLVPPAAAVAPSPLVPPAAAVAPSPLVPPASLAPVVAPAEPAPADVVAVSPPSADVHDPEPGRRSGRRAAASPGVTLDDATPPFGTPQVFVPVAVPVDEPSAPARAVPDLPYAFTGALPAASLRPEPDARLVDLARRGGSVALVWTRARRGVTHEAVLLADGTIQAPDGQTYADPSTAAERIVDAQVPVDGWRVWHVGSATGPTLAEACSAQPQP